MRTETQIVLVKTYLELARLHRQAAAECRPHSSLRNLHHTEADKVEAQGNAWCRLAEPVMSASGQAVCHG